MYSIIKRDEDGMIRPVAEYKTRKEAELRATDYRLKGVPVAVSRNGAFDHLAK